MQPDKDLIDRIANDYSIKELIKTCISDDPYPNLGLFRKKTYIICSIFSISIALILVFFSMILFSIIFFIIGLISATQYSKILGYEEGINEGIIHGHESGKITFGLELLQSKNVKDRLSHQIDYLLYQKNNWLPDKENIDHYNFHKFIKNNYDFTKSLKK